MTDPRARALGEIAIERERQERLRAEGRFKHTCASPRISLTEKLAILLEEVGEVARETLTQPGAALANDTAGSPEGLRRELVHVAAVAVAFIEGLEPEPEPEQEPEPEAMISPAQMRAFYAMARDLDAKNGLEEGTTKAGVKTLWAKESMRDFTRSEAGSMLDQLDHQLTDLGLLAYE